MAVLPSKELVKDAVAALAVFDELLSSDEFITSWKLFCKDFSQLDSALQTLISVNRWFLNYATLTPQNSSLPPSTLQIGKQEEPKSPEQGQEQEQAQNQADGKKRKLINKLPKRQPGGQPGHKGTTLTRYEHPDERRSVYPNNLPEGRDFTFFTYKSRQVVEVELVRKVIEYEYIAARDVETGQTYLPEVPAEHSRPIQYGNSVKAMLVYFNAVQFLPYKRTVSLFQDLAGFSVSQGTLYNALKEIYDKLRELGVDKIISANLLVQPVMHADETYVTVKKLTFYFHILTGGNWSYQYCSAKRGREAHEEAGILPLFLHVLVHDCFVSYFTYKCEHALCIVHLIRELTKVYETTEYRWPERFIDYFARQYEKVYVKYKDQRCLPPDELAVARRSYKSLCTRAWNEMTKGLPHDHPDVKKEKKRHAKAFSVLERLTNYMDMVLLWMARPEVPFSNNAAERDARMLKIHEKISNCFRNFENAQMLGLLRSFLMTCQKHGITNLHQVLTDALDGKLPEFMKYPEEASDEQSSGSMSEPASPVDEGAEQVDNTVPHDPAAAGTSGEDAYVATTDADTKEPAAPTIEQSKPQTTASSKKPPAKPLKEASSCARQQPSPPSAQPTACNEDKARPNGDAFPLERLEIDEGQRDSNTVPISTCLPPPARSTGITDSSCPG